MNTKMAVSSPLSSRRTVAALLTLTAVTGLVDAVSYLRLGRARPCRRRAGRWLAAAFAGEAVILGLVAVLTGTSVLPFAGGGRLATIAILAAALGVQNSTVRHLGAPDLTTTVLTLTLTGLAADSALAGGPGPKPHRRLGSVAAMLAGALAGAGILQWSPTAVIAIARTPSMSARYSGRFIPIAKSRDPKFHAEHHLECALEANRSVHSLHRNAVFRPYYRNCSADSPIDRGA